jgi:hypothetical protein
MRNNYPYPQTRSCRKTGDIMHQDRQDIKIEVIAYSGYKANERPMYFVLGLKKMEVKSVVDRWYGPEHDYFKVLSDNGRVYIIKWNRTLDAWFLVRILDDEGFDLV